MKKTYIHALAACAALLPVMNLNAARYAGFETDAFNRAFPASYRHDIAFSPASFEFDCVVFAEALDTIGRANMAEKMGVLTDFESVYQPIFAEYAARTNGFWTVMTRGFVLPNIEKSLPMYRILMRDQYNAAVCQAFPKKGPEMWFRAQMDGEMEDFEIPNDAALDDRRYSYYDLISVHAEFETSLPYSSRGRFRAIDGKDVEVDYMSGVQRADVMETKNFTLIRLPMKGGCEFYVMTPKADVELGDIRNEISSTRIDGLFATLNAAVDGGVVSHGPVEISLPKLKFRSRVDFSGVMRYFRFPLMGLKKAVGDYSSRELIQCVKFELDGGKADGSASAPAPAERKFVLDRPFLFFIHQPSTVTTPVAGQFTGVK